MTKELEFPERRPEALFEHSQDRLVEAVKEWVDHAGGVDPQDLLRELNKAVIEQVDGSVEEFSSDGSDPAFGEASALGEGRRSP